MKEQQEIDRLKEENARLKDRLRYQERSVKEGFFGASTPSSKLPLKPNASAAPKRAMPDMDDKLCHWPKRTGFSA